MEPFAQIENHEEWEYLLINGNYEFVYADGLNRFYIASEHIALKGHFKYPPNFFDYFIPHETALLMQRAENAEFQFAKQMRRSNLFYAQKASKMLWRVHVRYFYYVLRVENCFKFSEPFSVNKETD